MLEKKYLCNVLVVDDDADVRALIAEQLMALGCATVYMAQSGNDALMLLKSKKVDLLISDLQMPNMDGVELIRHLAKAKYRGGLMFISSSQSHLIGAASKIAENYGLKLLGAADKSKFNAELLAEMMVKNHDMRPPLRLSTKTHAREEDIIEAVKSDQFHFSLLPKVNCSNKKSCGYELLARWDHPSIGDVPPGLFLKQLMKMPEASRLFHKKVIAEGMGLLVKLNESEGHDTHQVSVNMPLSAFNSPSMCDELIKQAQLHNIQTSCFLIEVNTQDGLADERLAMEVLTRLRLNGFPLALDDFGTENSNADMLLKLPFSELKIDRQFVSNMTTDKMAYTFTKMAVSMAKAAGLKVTAEGVETPMQWSMLDKMGCDFAQGFYFSEPVEMQSVSAIAA